MTLGACKRCGDIVYEMRGQRVGRMLDHGTQVEFQLSDGSECAITLCIPCADAMGPADYYPLWQTIVDDSPDVPGGKRFLAERFPMAILRRRRSVRPGEVEIDRR